MASALDGITVLDSAQDPQHWQQCSYRPAKFASFGLSNRKMRKCVTVGSSSGIAERKKLDLRAAAADRENAKLFRRLVPEPMCWSMTLRRLDLCQCLWMR